MSSVPWCAPSTTLPSACAAYDPNRQWFGVLEMLASLALFCTALLYVRWRHQLNRRLAADLQPA